MIMRPGPGAAPTFSENEFLSGVDCPFLLSSHKETLVARGVRDYLEGVSVEHLPEVAAQHFANHAREGLHSAVVGLLPFRRDGKPHLFEPVSIQRSVGNLPFGSLPSRRVAGRCSVMQEPSREDYREMVRQALEMMYGDGPLQKVVLSRCLQVRSESPIDVGSLLQRLAADRHATTFSVTLPGGTGTLVGATPELLLKKRGNRFASFPLAGSARRRKNPVEDKAVAEALLHSEKDLREHAAVVESVVEALSPWCRNIHAAPTPSVMPTATMWHLGTRIEGEIRDETVTSLHLAAALHPTAAVCGQPREEAAAAIETLESFDRGFFTGAVGWSDSEGDGQWMVTIRCAEILGNSARLYAGAGIVTGSDPEAEAAETSAKFETLLRALGIDETGRLLDEAAA